jgi:thioredoxin-dependent peroxiredoxin
MKAPAFSLPDQNGTLHSLEEYTNTWRVVYFYPKDDTPGCTIEACNFRDSMSELKKFGIHIFGISKDTVQSHKKFADKFQLNFPLLSDVSTETIKAYGAWAPKKFMGREFLGIVRKTYLINPVGDIIKTYEGMKLEQHAQEILQDIQSYQA